MNTTILNTPTEILARVIGPENPSFSAEVARSVLAFGFPSNDIDRMNDLAGKAQKGVLSDSESEQLQGYLLVGAVIDLLHSKARISLKGSSI